MLAGVLKGLVEKSLVARILFILCPIAKSWDQLACQLPTASQASCLPQESWHFLLQKFQL